MKKKFIKRVYMKVTKEQFEKDLKEPLQNLGYKIKGCTDFESFPYLVNRGEEIYNVTESGVKREGATEANNPELFLALAAMTDGLDWVVGEYLITTEAMDHDANKIFKCKSLSGSNFAIGWAENGSMNYIKATVQELINHFTPSKKIIGYKCPHDLFAGNIKKGSIFSIYSPHKLYMYYPENASRGVPTEIVHTWEPVYEEGFKIGDYIFDEEYGVCQITGVHSMKNGVVRYDRTPWSSGKASYDTSFYSDSVLGERVRLATPQEIENSREEVFDMGHFKLTLKGGKVFHQQEDITTFVKDLVEETNNYMNRLFTLGDKFYSAYPNEITFNKTGCEHSQTEFSDWRKIYDKLALGS